jgi:uncharacterized protein with von Willebrand factor type A (vWA) domain
VTDNRGFGAAGTVTRFVAALREAGVGVSVSESIDAVESLRYADISDRQALKAALAATLVKSRSHYQVFETLFEIFFAPRSSRPWPESVSRDTDDSSEDGSSQEVEPDGSPGGFSGAGGGEALGPEEFRAMLLAALLDADFAEMRALAIRAVAVFAGMEPGRPVAGTYYLYRTLQQVDVDGLMERAMREIVARIRNDKSLRMSGASGTELTELEMRLLREEIAARIDKLREFIQDEIRRRLVEDRGPEALAKSVQKPLPEEIEFMHATSAEIRELRRAVHPLTRKLAARLARTRRKREGQRIDMRKTIRRSMSTGGVPFHPQFRAPHPNKPELFLLCDISGSVANFARFTLQLVYAMASQFSRVRSWVFVDAIDEVTEHFERAGDINEALHKVNTEAEVIWVDGHSDYGHVLSEFWKAHERDVTAKTTIIILGDARNNYHASHASILREMGRKARRILWLNPEPVSYWNTGDSVIGEYAVGCDGVWECRNLKQLERFVTSLV